MNGIKTKGEMKFQVITHLTLTIFSLIGVLPFLLLAISSFTDENTLLTNGYSFFPQKLSMGAYSYLLSQWQMILRAYGITIFITVVGTTVSLLIQPMLAYPLSRKDFSKRNLFTFLVFFTMLFNGGLVPTYIMWTQIFHIKNTIYALIIPGLLANAFNVILMKNYFASNIPPALIEAAQIDGASEYRIFFRIVLPLSMPMMATIGLMVGIGYWNDWMNGLYYLSKPQLYSLQVLLNQILQNIQYLASNGNSTTIGVQLPSASIRMAIAVIGIIPIIALYPFFQKYFVKGITIGAVKG